MNKQQMVIIENKAGAQYAVMPDVYEGGKDADYKGFAVVSHEDGTAYERPAPAKAEKLAPKGKT